MTRTIHESCARHGEQDFTFFTLDEIADFLVAHQAELDTEGTTATEVLEAVRSGKAALEMRPWGFSLVQLSAAAGTDERIPHLWALYVTASLRGKGYGAKFIRELLKKYSNHFHMTLHCSGTRRRKFFGRFGFRVESKIGEVRRMTTNPTPWR